MENARHEPGVEAMSSPPDEPMQHRSAGTTGHDRDRQRVALADYVDLSVESVRAAETEIAQRQQSDVEAAEEEFEERTQRIRRRLAAFVEVMRREFGE